MGGESLSGPAASPQGEVARLVWVVAALRDHCPWTAALTHASLTTYVLEEAHEVIAAIEGLGSAGDGSAGDGGSGDGGRAELANELGDLLLQVVLHARLGEEAGSFDLASVAGGLSAKLIRRSPHVFHADGSLRESFPATLDQIEATWEQVKAQERAAAGTPGAPGAAGTSASGTRGATGPLAGIPAGLPALAAAHKTIERAQRAALELPPATGQWPGPGQPADEAELGRLLFAVAQAAHARGLDAERALRHAVREVQNGAWPSPGGNGTDPNRKV